ncbi:MAG: hypothetical protein AB7U62_04070 [Pseudolabrys sp.]
MSANEKRFTWNSERDDDLRRCYQHASIEQLEQIIGCKRWAIYKRIRDLDLSPADPVRRAIHERQAPTAFAASNGVTLATPEWLSDWTARLRNPSVDVFIVSPAGVAVPAGVAA